MNHDSVNNMKENKLRTSMSELARENEFNMGSFNDNMNENILRWYKLNPNPNNNNMQKFQKGRKHDILSTKSNEYIDEVSSFPKRSGAASILYKDHIYVFGGYKLNKRLNDFYKYNIIKNKWINITNKNRPSRRENNPSFVYKDRMYIIGGYEGNEKWVNDFHFFDLHSEIWGNVRVEENSKIYAPVGCFGYALAVDTSSGILYIFGGYDGKQLHNKMHAFDLDLDRWINLGKQSGDIPSPRSCAVGHICDGYFYMFGGYNGNEGSNSLYQYHLTTGIWTKIKYNMAESMLTTNSFVDKTSVNDNVNDSSTDSNYTNRNTMSRSSSSIGSNSVYDDRTMCGDKNNNKKKKMICNNNNKKCYISSKEIPTPRYFMGSFVHNNCIYILGGYNGMTSKRLNDLYKYDIHNRTWEKIITTHNFSERSSMNIHYYKNVIYCLAGFDGATTLNDVYILRLENVYTEPSSLKHDYKNMVNNYKYSDVVFVLQNRYIYGCSSVISARCPSFKCLFDSYLLKKDGVLGDTKINNHTPIRINDIDHDTLLIILNYIYTDEIYMNYSLETYLKILVVVSNKFYIFRLLQICEQMVTKRVNNSNVFDLLLLSYRNDCKQLCKFCIDYVIYNNLLDSNKFNMLIVEPHLLGELYKMSLSK